MKITRIGEVKDISRLTDRIEFFSSNGDKYTITDDFGDIRIHAHDSKIVITPGCANEIIIGCAD